MDKRLCYNLNFKKYFLVFFCKYVPEPEMVFKDCDAKGINNMLYSRFRQQEPDYVTNATFMAFLTFIIYLSISEILFFKYLE